MLNQKDTDMPKMLKMFTFLPLPEVEALLRKHEAKPENRYAQVDHPHASIVKMGRSLKIESLLIKLP